MKWFSRKESLIKKKKNDDDDDDERRKAKEKSAHTAKAIHKTISNNNRNDRFTIILI